MKLFWHQKDPSLLARLREDLAQHYPDLTLIVEREKVCLRGTFPLVHNNIELDRFAIEVTIPGDFPREIPRVRETAGRIPHVALWHAFRNGELCIIVPEEWLIHPNAASVCAFLDGPVRNYFLNHTLAEQGIERPMGERDHGSAGLLQAYGELVGSKEARSIERYLEYVAQKKIKSHWTCPCGSGKCLRDCHLKHVAALRNKIPRWIADMALTRLKDQMKRESGEGG